MNCPNCGAPPTGSSATCAYCGGPRPSLKEEFALELAKVSAQGQTGATVAVGLLGLLAFMLLVRK